MNRIDRDGFYLAVLLTGFLAAIKVLPNLPAGHGPMRYMPMVTQQLAATAALIGCTVALIGAMLGAPLVSRVPLRYCYAIGAFGLVAFAVATAVLSINILPNDATTGDWNYIFTPALFIATVDKMIRLWREYRRRTTAYGRG